MTETLYYAYVNLASPTKPGSTPCLHIASNCIQNIKCWDHESILRLRGCLACTDRDSFKYMSNDIHEYADTVTSYIGFCQDVYIPQKTVKVFSNDEPWFTRNLRPCTVQKNQVWCRKSDTGSENCLQAQTRRPVPFK